MFDKEHITFEQWMVVLNNIAVNQYGYLDMSIDPMNPNDWYAHYDDGYTPEDALQEPK